MSPTLSGERRATAQGAERFLGYRIGILSGGSDMEVRGIKLHDMHLHIQKGSTVQQYLQKAQTLAFELLAVTGHVWDMSSVPVQHTAHSPVGLG